MDPLTMYGIGMGAQLIGGWLGGGSGRMSDTEIMASKDRLMGGMPQLGSFDPFQRTSLGASQQFRGYDQGFFDQAGQMLDPLLQAGMQSVGREQAASNVRTGQSVAAGNLSPAQQAALVSQNALSSGLERSSLLAEMAGQQIGLGSQLQGANFAAQQAQQAATFGEFDRRFAQNQFDANFGRQSALDRFNAGMEREQMAANLLGLQMGQPQEGNMWDTLGGMGNQFAQMGLLGYGHQQGWFPPPSSGSSGGYRSLPLPFYHGGP